VPQVHYLGPRQVRARLNPQTSQRRADGTPVPQYICLGAAGHCLP
jgi:hypothetical protein